MTYTVKKENLGVMMQYLNYKISEVDVVPFIKDGEEWVEVREK